MDLLIELTAWLLQTEAEDEAAAAPVAPAHGFAAYPNELARLLGLARLDYRPG